MRKTIKTTTIALAALVLGLTFTSCKKEKIKGCTTSYATNYNSTAEEDDGSCSYSAKIIFWQKAASASTWPLSVTALKFYFDGQYIGSCLATESTSSAPGCSSNGQASVTKNLGNSKIKTFSYSIKDQNNIEYDSGNITLNAADACQSFEMQ